MMEGFCLFSYPGESRISGYSSKNAIVISNPFDLAETIYKYGNGFIIAPFDITNHPIVIIPFDEYIYEFPEKSEFNQPDFFPNCSTSRDEHQKEVTAIVDLLNTLDNNSHTKIVAARTKIVSNQTPLKELLSKISNVSGQNFCFFFYTSYTGLWLGASPEVLLSSRDTQLSTMALAGTRPHINGDPDGQRPWDIKNIREQSAVTNYIVTSLEQEGFGVRLGSTASKIAGNIEHIITPIYANIASYNKNDTRAQLSKVINTALKLSPTPALSGNPKDLAMNFIKENETFDRSFYGGFCGTFTKNRSENNHTSSDIFNIDLYVNLRSGLFTTDRAALFAGGGITPLSDPAEEWIETERKLTTLASLL